MKIIKIYTKIFESYSEANKTCKKIMKYGYNPYVFTQDSGYNVLIATTPNESKANEIISFLKKIGIECEVNIKTL